VPDPAGFEDSRRHSYTELDDTGGGVKRVTTTVYYGTALDGERVGIARVLCSGSVDRLREGSLVGSLLLDYRCLFLVDY